MTWLFDKINRVPPISDTQISLMRHIEPVLREDGLFRRIAGVNKVHARDESFLWDAKPTGEPFLYEAEWKARYRQITNHGTAFEGDSGWVHVDRGNLNLQSEELNRVSEDSFRTKLIQSKNHARNFLDCVKSRAETVSPIDVAVAGDALCHIADIACRLGRKLTFDLKKERFVNDDAANQCLKARPMRKPWHL